MWPHSPDTSKRRPLALLLGVLFLLNIQAGYACMMMPDMAQEQIECCCGPDHRMPELGQDPGLHDQHHSELPATDSANNSHGLICNDPQLACCQVEISVGINDPPDEDADAYTLLTKATIKAELPTKTAAVTSVFTEPFMPARSQVLVSRAKPPNPALLRAGAPLYKTTERYRI